MRFFIASGLGIPYLLFPMLRIEQLAQAVRECAEDPHVHITSETVDCVHRELCVAIYQLATGPADARSGHTPEFWRQCQVIVERVREVVPSGNAFQYTCETIAHAIAVVLRESE